VKLEKKWLRARTDYSIALVGNAFAEAHGGECDYYIPEGFCSRAQAEKRAAEKQAEYNRRGRKGRFIVKAHRRKAGWALHGSLSL